MFMGALILGVGAGAMASLMTFVMGGAWWAAALAYPTGGIFVMLVVSIVMAVQQSLRSSHVMSDELPR